MKSIECLKDQHVLVVGDMMVDKYILGQVNRISPEAPVPVLKQSQINRKLGGTGNVIVNLAALGARVRAFGRVGDDADGLFFRETLRQCDVDDRFILFEGSTIVKTRVAAGNQQFIRIDEETIMPPSDAVFLLLNRVLEQLFQDITVVAISDYNKGFLSPELTQIIIAEARKRQLPVLVDPKGKDASKYRGATAITPNNKEFLDMTGLSALPDEDSICQNALRLCKENDFERIFFTRSEKGISVIEQSNGQKKDYPAEKKEVIDVTGAGDTVLAVIALAAGAGFSPSQCVRIANIAASVVISKFGAASTSIAEISEILHPMSYHHASYEDAIKRIRQLKAEGKRIVFTNGCFDLVHAGHISSFQQARTFGDVLVVGINSDDSIRRIKGPSRPIVTLDNRLKLLQAIKYVDFVIPFEDDTPQKLIEAISPDVLVKGKDWEGKEVAGAAYIQSIGGVVEFIDLEIGLSTTNLIQKIKNITE